jgi:hypothetical protein
MIRKRFAANGSGALRRSSNFGFALRSPQGLEDFSNLKKMLKYQHQPRGTPSVGRLAKLGTP